MTIFAGIVITAFGAGGAWLMTQRFPTARFLRAGYVLMACGGVCFIVWALLKSPAIGLVAAGLLALGGAIGAIGAIRKELRF